MSLNICCYSRKVIMEKRTTVGLFVVVVVVVEYGILVPFCGLFSSHVFFPILICFLNYYYIMFTFFLVP